MSETLFSPYWYRAAGLHPRLVSTIQISRQTFKSEHWHVLSNLASGRQFRINDLGYQLVGRLDGRRSVQEIWDLLIRELGNDAPSQHEVLGILSELSGAGMLHSESSPDLGAVFEASQRRRQRGAKRLNPLAFKVSLFDPTPLLDHLQGFGRGLFRRWVFVAWLALCAAGLLLAGMHWPELSSYASRHLSGSHNLFLMWFIYPLIKAVHELGHALAIRRWGGEVREIGVTVFLVMPVPYVDASAASGFPEKHRRILISSMGVMVELGIAALSLLLWLHVSDGWLREAAFAAMVIGGVSTLLVNANPLMRFDGYYVLVDWLEMPGLATRADAWLRYLGERWLLGNKRLRRPPGSHGNAVFLSCFGLASLTYRVILLGGMAAWLATKQLVLGLALGAWLLLRYLALPAWKLLHLVLHGARLAPVRTQAVSVTLGGLLLLVLVGFVIPAPHVTHAPGLVWLPEEARIRNTVEGFVSEVLVQDGQTVTQGQPLLVLSNPDLEARRTQLQTRLLSQQLAYQRALLSQPTTAVALQETLESLAGQLHEVDSQLAELRITAPLSGQLGLAQAKDLPGRFFARGSVIANVIDPRQTTVRAVLQQVEVDLLREPLRAIAVRTAEDRRHSFAATIKAQEPAASYELPSATLGDRGGGDLLTDPTDAQGIRSLAPIFVVDVLVPELRLQRIGGRAWLRLEHTPMPLGLQWLRSLRQLLTQPLDTGISPATGL